MTRRFFFGGNTPSGFYSYYDNIIQTKRGYTIYIKGGAGVGKSTLMRKVGAAAEKKGSIVEYLHCSGDASSLDGVYLPERHFCVLDGTAPHILDTKVVGIYDETLDLGAFVKSGVSVYGEVIRTLYDKKSRLYRMGYAALSAAGELYKEALILGEAHTARHLVYIKVLEHMDELGIAATNEQSYIRKYRAGEVRKCFSSAISPDGRVSFYTNNRTNAQVINIVSDTYATLFTFTELLTNELLLKRVPVELYYHPMAPTSVEALLLKEQNVLIKCSPLVDSYSQITYGSIEKSDAQSEKTIDISCCRMARINRYIGELHKNTILCNALIDEAISCIKRAQDCHKEVEKYYSDYMEWDGVNEKTAYVISKIEA